MENRKIRKRRKKNRLSNGLFSFMLYLFVKPVKLLFKLSIYSLKSIWLVFSFSMRLLYKLIKLLPTNYPSKPIMSTLAEIDEMDGYKFEEFMKCVYEQLGYLVYHTPFSGDQGADLILTSKGKTRIAVQVKRYSGKVSNSAVQEVVAAKGFYKCTGGIVVTNSYFTDSARQLAKANFIDLVDRNELEKLINALPN
jgi:restriction system protein